MVKKLYKKVIMCVGCICLLLMTKVFFGCEKESKNHIQNCQALASLNMYYDASLVSQFLTTPIVGQLETTLDHFNINTNQNILQFLNEEDVNKLYDTLIFFSKKWDSLSSVNSSYAIYNSDNFPDMPMLYAFEYFMNFHSLRAEIEENTLQLESTIGIDTNSDPDNHYIVSPFMRALLSPDCEIIIGNYIYLYGDSLNLKIPDLNFDHLQQVKSLINQYGEYVGSKTACYQHIALQLHEENEDDTASVCIGRNSDGTYTFHIQSEYEVTSCVWNFGDGFTSSQIMPKHNFAATGIYNVVVTFYLNNSNQAITLAKTINNNGPCYVTIDHYNEGKGMCSFYATAKSDEGAIPTNYVWYFKDDTRQYHHHYQKQNISTVLTAKNMSLLQFIFPTDVLQRIPWTFIFSEQETVVGKTTKKKKKIYHIAATLKGLNMFFQSGM